MTTEAHRMAVRRYKDKMIAKGWCAHCFVTQDLETQRLCQRCAEMNRERARASGMRVHRRSTGFSTGFPQSKK